MTGLNVLFLLDKISTETEVAKAQQTQPSPATSLSHAIANVVSSPLEGPPSNNGSSSSSSSSNTVVIGVVVGIVGAILILSAIGAVWMRHRASDQAQHVKQLFDLDGVIVKDATSVLPKVQSSGLDVSPLGKDPISPSPVEKWDPIKEVQALATKFKAPDIDKVKLLELIGEGAFGRVYRGRWRELDVAVKTVLFSHTKGSGNGPEKRAVMEAAVASTIVHPNIVATYHYDIKRIRAVQGKDGAIQIEDSSRSDWKLYLIQVSAALNC